METLSSLNLLNFNHLIFRTNFEATPPPILIDNGLAVLENEKIERHIMKTVPGGHNLFVQDKEVATLIENLYSVSILLLPTIFLYFFLKLFYEVILIKPFDNIITVRESDHPLP